MQTASLTEIARAEGFEKPWSNQLSGAQGLLTPETRQLNGSSNRVDNPEKTPPVIDAFRQK